MTTKIMTGDVRDQLRLLPSESVHCCITSPPYWGLRNYLPDGHEHKHREIGLENSVGEHIAMLVDVFREVRRVLRKDGTLWVNYGDAYASAPNGRSAADTKDAGNDDRTFRDKPISTVGGTFKPKDRMLLPARVAIALQDDGWWIRDEIIWHKPNPMPSSVKDRTTPAHEMIYMLSRAPRYYYDQEAVLEPCSPNTHARLAQDVQNQIGSERANGGVRADRPMKAVQRKSWKGSSFDGERDRLRHPDIGKNRALPGCGSFDDALAIMPVMRNPRSVWTIPPKGFKEAHFATFPPDLIRPCILAGCPPGGTVLDPFGGAGTTALVAQQEGRNAILIELNPAYVEIARRRLGLTSFALPITTLRAELAAIEAIRALQSRLGCRA